MSAPLRESLHILALWSTIISRPEIPRTPRSRLLLEETDASFDSFQHPIRKLPALPRCKPCQAGSHEAAEEGEEVSQGTVDETGVESSSLEHRVPRLKTKTELFDAGVRTVGDGDASES